MNKIILAFTNLLLWHSAFAQISQQPYLLRSTEGHNLEVFEYNSKKTSFSLPLLLLHGGGPGAMASFDLPAEGGALARDLAHEGLVIYTMNVRGWEGSGMPKDSDGIPGTVEEASRDIRAVINWISKKEKVDRIHLFGWATGGHWISYFADKVNQEKIASISVLNSLTPVDAPWSLRKYFADAEDSTRYDNSVMYRKSKSENLTKMWSQTIPVDNKYKWRDPAIEQLYRKIASSFGEDTNILKVPAGYRKESFYLSKGKRYWNIDNISVPYFYIRSKHDFWSRNEDLIYMKDRLTWAHCLSKAVEIPGTHYVFLDRPQYGRDRLIELLLGFISSVEFFMETG